MKNNALWIVVANFLANTAAYAEPTRIALTYQYPGAYTLTAQLVDNVSREFLFDTGSSLVVLSAQTFAEISAYETPSVLRRIYGAMADGGVVETNVFQISKLVLGDGCVLRNVEAVVLPGAKRNILGLSALRQLGAMTLEFDGPTLIFAQCQTSQRMALRTQ